MYEVIENGKATKGFDSWSDANNWGFFKLNGLYEVEEDERNFCKGCRNVKWCQCPSSKAYNCNF